MKIFQAKIECPHCHKPVTVRSQTPDAADIKPLFDEMDTVFARMSGLFDGIFKGKVKAEKS